MKLDLSKKIMECKLCNQTTNMANSHIIPKNFFNDLKNENNEQLKLYSHSYPQRRLKGTYDSNILCNNCETKYQKIDSDFIKYINELTEKYKNYKFLNNTHHLEIEINDINIIRKFLLFTIWKAHHSTTQEYKEVDLGIKYENKIKNNILDCNLDMSGFMFIPWVKTDWENLYIREIVKTRISNILYYNIDIGKYYFYLKFSKCNSNFPENLWIPENQKTRDNINSKICQNIIP